MRQPGELGQGKTIGTCTSAVGSGNGVNFFYRKNYKCLLEVDFGWKGDLLSWDRFSPYKQSLRILFPWTPLRFYRKALNYA